MAEPVKLRNDEPPQDIVTITQQTGVRFTPNELRGLKAETGRSLNELMGEDADDADRMQTLAWLRLRREGRTVPWEECGDIEVELRVEEPPDPTSGNS